MLEVGKNSYISVENADELVRILFPTYDGYRVYWSVLTEDEKESYLIRSMQQIESLHIAGCKHNLNQLLKFPRIKEKGVSETVKMAQFYNAIGCMNDDLKSAEKTQQQSLQSLGIAENMKFNKRFSAEIDMGTTSFAVKKNPLSSVKAYNLLKPYLFGGFQIV